MSAWRHQRQHGGINGVAENQTAGVSVKQSGRHIASRSEKQKRAYKYPVARQRAYQHGAIIYQAVIKRYGAA